MAAAYLSEVLLRMWAPEATTSELADGASNQRGSSPVISLDNDGPDAGASKQLVLPALPDPPAPLHLVGPRSPHDERGRRRGVASTDLSQATLKADLHIGSNRAVDVYQAIRPRPGARTQR